MNNFELHPQLKSDTFLLAELQLCDARLMNDRRFPWLILVPRRAGARELTDLLPGDQRVLLDEITMCSRFLQQEFSPDKMNIAALGNMVPQLHIHVIARFKTDSAWPKPVWGVGAAEKYSATELENLKTAFNAFMRPVAAVQRYSS